MNRAPHFKPRNHRNRRSKPGSRDKTSGNFGRVGPETPASWTGKSVVFHGNSENFGGNSENLGGNLRLEQRGNFESKRGNSERQRGGFGCAGWVCRDTRTDEIATGTSVLLQTAVLVAAAGTCEACDDLSDHQHAQSRIVTLLRLHRARRRTRLELARRERQLQHAR